LSQRYIQFSVQPLQHWVLVSGASF
jgi:hypothetical protein